jgi:hypothetical protein
MINLIICCLFRGFAPIFLKSKKTKKDPDNIKLAFRNMIWPTSPASRCGLGVRSSTQITRAGILSSAAGRDDSAASSSPDTGSPQFVPFAWSDLGMIARLILFVLPLDRRPPPFGSMFAGMVKCPKPGRPLIGSLMSLVKTWTRPPSRPPRSAEAS